MKLCVKRFDELSIDELFNIYKLRVDVFVVEQQCPYHEIDEEDKSCLHLWLEDETGIVAYARVLEPNSRFVEASIGRVIAKKRRKGHGTAIVKAAIKCAVDNYNVDKIVIEAQYYAKEFYEKLGFKQVSKMFLEDGVPHIKMILCI